MLAHQAGFMIHHALADRIHLIVCPDAIEECLHFRIFRSEPSTHRTRVTVLEYGRNDGPFDVLAQIRRMADVEGGDLRTIALHDRSSTAILPPSDGPGSGLRR